MKPYIRITVALQPTSPRDHEFESRSFRCGKQKAYIGGWIYTEYSLAMACSVFRSRQYSYFPVASPQLYSHAIEVDDHKEVDFTR